MCYQESIKREITFTAALLLSVFLTPIVSYVIILNRPLRNARGCEWCGNSKYESEICGLCGNQTKPEETAPLDHLVE
ncbi:MAG: hypothetical protein ACI9JN_002712 [Bacteroidia bacterium]|jgi:hypothetical protein